MLRRLTAGIVCCFALTAGALQWERAPAQPTVKPILYVFSASYCGPCHIFDTAYQDDPQFARLLSSSFDMRKVDTQRADLNHLVRRFAIDTVPAFVVADPRNGFCMRNPDGSFRRSVGFNTANVEQAKRDLLSDLGLRTVAAVQSSPPHSTGPPATARPASDQDSRRLQLQIEGLSTTIEQINERLAATLSDNAELRNALQRERQDSGSAARAEITAELAAERRELQELRQQLQIELNAAIQMQKAAAAEPAADTTDEPQPDAATTADPPTPKPAAAPAEPAADKDSDDSATPSAHTQTDAPLWDPDTDTVEQVTDRISRVGWIARTIATVAAPEVAVPLSLASTVGGFLIGRWRERRRSRHKGRTSTATTDTSYVDERSHVQTHTKYVVTETDILGEAYREAVRRVANDHRESKPYIADICASIDQIAKHIAHGRRITQRPAKEPRPETDPDTFPRG